MRMAAMFSLAAFIFSQATIRGALLVIIVMLIVIELFVEKVGLVGKDYKPLLKFLNLKKMINSKNR